MPSSGHHTGGNWRRTGACSIGRRVGYLPGGGRKHEVGGGDVRTGSAFESPLVWVRCAVKTACTRSRTSGRCSCDLHTQ